MAETNVDVERLNEQIADLKAELVELSGKVRSGAEQAKQAVAPALGAIRDNPGTVSSVAITAGLIGVAIGYMLGASAEPASSWRKF
jgi:ElaB/YqjD/DUF883 family membrane-anchored ribosome-binding protein